VAAPRRARRSGWTGTRGARRPPSASQPPSAASAAAARTAWRFAPRARALCWRCRRRQERRWAALLPPLHARVPPAQVTSVAAREAAAEARDAAAEHEDALQALALRTAPLGADRHHRTYWWPLGARRLSAPPRARAQAHELSSSPVTSPGCRFLLPLSCCRPANGPVQEHELVPSHVMSPGRPAR